MPRTPARHDPVENSVSIAATFEIEYLQYLDATGKLVRDDLPAFARDTRQLVKLYQEMVMARVFDAKAIALLDATGAFDNSWFSTTSNANVPGGWGAACAAGPWF